MDKIEKNWDDMAKAYVSFTEGESSYSNLIEWPCIQGLLPDLSNADILDLGCGAGRFCFLLEKLRPKSILGIDLSENMLDIAKTNAHAAHSIASFQKGDIGNLDFLAGDSYDFVFSSTTLHYLPDLKQLFRNIQRVLRKDGKCILSVMHPVYTAQYPVDKNGLFPEDEDWQVRYLDKSTRAYVQPWIEYNNQIEDFLTTSYHHTMGDYINAMIQAGFALLRIEEPGPPEEWKSKLPGRYESFMETPSYLIFLLKKQA